MTVKNKKILIIVGGGISAYKSLDLIRLLKKNNNDVKAILTKSNIYPTGRKKIPYCGA